MLSKIKSKLLFFNVSSGVSGKAKLSLVAEIHTLRCLHGFGLSCSVVNSKSALKGEPKKEKAEKSRDRSGCTGLCSAKQVLFNTSKAGLKARHIV